MPASAPHRSAPLGPDGGPPDREVVVVRAGGRRVAILVHDVVEVQRMVAWEPLPAAPAAVEGVVDLRGRVVPVLDLAERLGLPSRPPLASDHLVIVRGGRHVLAVRVEEALSLDAVPGSAFTAGEAIGPSLGRVRGVVRLRGSLLVVADLERFLGWDEEEALDGALASRAERPVDG